jgi:hypothetical protein
MAADNTQIVRQPQTPAKRAVRYGRNQAQNLGISRCTGPLRVAVSPLATANTSYSSIRRAGESVRSSRVWIVIARRRCVSFNPIASVTIVKGGSHEGDCDCGTDQRCSFCASLGASTAASPAKSLSRSGWGRRKVGSSASPRTTQSKRGLPQRDLREH